MELLVLVQCPGMAGSRTLSPQGKGELHPCLASLPTLPPVPHPQKAPAVLHFPTLGRGQREEVALAAPGCGTGTGVTGLGPARSSGLGGLALSESQTWSMTH